MSPWFQPEAAPLFSFFSLLSLLAVSAPWVKTARHKTAVTAAFAGALGIGILLLALGLVALNSQQPRYVVLALTLSGILLSVIFAVLLPVIRTAYREAEHRKVVASNL